MGENSKIEWCDHTVNLWWGCTEVHEGCDNCYARVLDNRYHHENTHWGNEKPRLQIKSAFKNLDKFQRDAAKEGVVKRVFIQSMSDIFEKPMMLESDRVFKLNTGELRDKLFEQITNGLYPNLMFLFLTKRPSNINKYIPEYWKENPPDNVMFGTSPVNQATANILIPQLLQVKGNKFLSCEPMLGPIDLNDINSSGVKLSCLYAVDRPYNLIEWVIVGGESGSYKRPFDADWARLIRDQCKVPNVAFFMKQIDKVQPIPEDLMIRQFPVI